MWISGSESSEPRKRDTMKRICFLIICLLLSACPVMAEETKQAGRNDMKITWIGHSCFKIESNGFTLILDPYEDGYVPGLKPLRESADMVLCSHDHGDHNAKDLVAISEGQACPFTITTIDTFHDEVQGAKRGPDTIHIIDDGKVRIAHLGDLGCELEEGQIEQLKGLDVCLIPVGGYYTIDGKQAAELVHLIHPRIVIPMHYRDDKAGFGFDVISTVEDFADCMDSVTRLDQSSITIDDLPDAQVVILTPRDAK